MAAVDRSCIDATVVTNDFCSAVRYGNTTEATHVCKQLFLLFNLLFAFCVFVLSSEVCAGLGNGRERFCTSRSLLGSYVHQKSI